LFPGLPTVAASILWGALCAGLLTYVGTTDLENYDHSFVSLDRGTAMQMVTFAGQPVYTTALGLGVRLPLHGNLSASPAAAVSAYLPEPLTYWLLFTFAIGASTLLLHLAAGMFFERLLAWCAAFLVFWSLPVSTYSINNDWPETAVTYWVIVAAIFAPHALLTVSGAATSMARRVAAGAGVLGLCWGLIAIAHPGYWPIIAATLALSAAIVLVRTDHPLRARLWCVALIAACSATAVALLAPDVLREVWILGGQSAAMKRTVRGPEGTLWLANARQPVAGVSRRPFTFLLLLLVSLPAVIRDTDVLRRRVAAGAAGLSLIFGVAASTRWPVLPTYYTPSAIWAFRDPAIVGTIFSACCAVAALVTSKAPARRVRVLAVLVLVTAAQGPLVATLDAMRERSLRRLVQPTMAPRGLSAPPSRIVARGLPPDRVAPGSRIALWPGVSSRLRNTRRPQADFVDAGYVLVTATTKQRTMRQVIFGHNDVLFEQSTTLPADTLCAPAAIRLLQLQYLLGPPGIHCDTWRGVPALQVHEWLDVYESGTVDTRIQAIPSEALSETLRHTPIFESDSTLLSLLQPQDGTRVSIGTGSVAVRWTRAAPAGELTYLLPIAFDAAWHASSGQVSSVGGLLALTDVRQPDVSVSFVPDVTSRLRVGAVVLAQIFTILALVGVASVAPVTAVPQLARHVREASRRTLTWGRRALLEPFLRWLVHAVRRLDALYTSYCVMVVAALATRAGSGDATLPAALLFPAAAIAITRATRIEATHEWAGRGILLGALVAVAAGGSLDAAALHDPLFWTLVAGVFFAVSWAPPRYRRLRLAAASVTGAAAAVAVLLTLFPQLWAAAGTLPAAAPEAARLLTSQLGIPAAVLLAASWVRAIGVNRAAWLTITDVTLMARTALVVWLLACAAGATLSHLDARWFTVLGLIVGLAARGAPGSGR
jgi:hypothetical protein